MSNFGERLKALRIKSGKSQAEIAQDLTNLGVPTSQGKLSLLEGRSDAPREDVLQTLATYFNVPVIEFFDSNECLETADHWQHIEEYFSGEIKPIREAALAMEVLRKMRIEARLAKNAELYSAICYGMEGLEVQNQERFAALGRAVFNVISEKVR